ncbi:MAG: hypothetical protein OEQ39_27365, partial [Gammaproteobacteria bacterium]|nr:hypothetical protein [Gammaproteobacteria bacterium]
MQWSMWGLAWLVRAGVVKQLERYARPLKRISGRFDRFGTDNGGMHVGLAGVGHDGAARSIDWFLTARQGHGPEIPCVPAIVLARKLAAGKVEWRGAMPCVGLISLDEFGDAVSHLNISSDALESG